MSHYNVAVIVPVQDGEDGISNLMNRFDATLQVKYVEPNGENDGHWTNPDGKYDYYDVVDEQSIDNWGPASGIYDDDHDELVKRWDELVETDFAGSMYKPEYLKSYYKDAEHYAKFNSVKECVPYAVVTPDGEWHAPGNVGWFGTDDATTESMDEFLDTFEEVCVKPYIDGEYRVYTLDCHI